MKAQRNSVQGTLPSAIHSPREVVKRAALRRAASPGQRASVRSKTRGAPLRQSQNEPLVKSDRRRVSLGSTTVQHPGTHERDRREPTRLAAHDKKNCHGIRNNILWPTADIETGRGGRSLFKGHKSSKSNGLIFPTRRSSAGGGKFTHSKVNHGSYVSASRKVEIPASARTGSGTSQSGQETRNSIADTWECHALQSRGHSSSSCCACLCSSSEPHVE